MTTQQRINCIKLMLSVTKKIRGVKFNMALMFSGSARDILKGSICGTSCCFLGHGPVAGIGECEAYMGLYGNWFNYSGYSECEFGITSGGRSRWDFLFHEDWPSIRSQAAARMQYVLLGGNMDRDSWNYKDKFEDLDRPYWNAELKELEGKG